MRKLLPILIILAVTGCSKAVTPTRGSQGVYEGETSFVAALKLVNTYAALPRCSATAKPPCSDQAVVNKASLAAAKADAAVQAARTIAVNSASTDPQVSSAAAAANTAIAALLAIIPTPAPTSAAAAH